MADLGDPSWSEIDASNDAIPPNGWPEGMFPSDVNNSARSQMGGEKRWWARSNSTQTTTGTSTAYVLTYAEAEGALYDGEETSFVLHLDCGADPTLDRDGLGAKNLRKFTGGAYVNLAASDVLADQPIRVRYNLADDKYDIVCAANDYLGTISPTGNTILAALQPQGRLTLVTATPVMSSSQASKTSIFYTPYAGNLAPIYDGTGLKWTVFPELTNTTTDSTKNPAAVANDKNYDLLIWNDAATVRLGRGPAWTSDTGRGSGAGTTELERVDGLLVNKYDITNGPAARRGTYVGSVRSDGSAQINWIPGAIGANGTAALLGVWNMYNRVEVGGFIGDSSDTWDYSIATWRAAHASNTMRVSAVSGFAEDSFSARYTGFFTNASASNSSVGIGYDSTSAASGLLQPGTSVSNNFAPAMGEYATQMLGFHYFQAVEICVSVSGTNTFYGDGGSAANFQSGLKYSWRA